MVLSTVCGNMGLRVVVMVVALCGVGHKSNIVCKSASLSIAFAFFAVVAFFVRDLRLAAAALTRSPRIRATASLISSKVIVFSLARWRSSVIRTVTECGSGWMVGNWVSIGVLLVGETYSTRG